MWKITKDHINTDPEDTSRVDTSGETINVGFGVLLPEIIDLPNTQPLVEFKLFDDDGELYYEGVLHDDDECLNQDAALAYGKYDAGATTIKVKRGNKWVQDIG